MESKLLVGGKTIIDHTNEQQKMLELKRQEIAEQVCKKIIIGMCFFPPKLLPIKHTFVLLFNSY